MNDLGASTVAGADVGDWSAVAPVTDLFSVRDRVALVTGATAGLGRRMAAVLHAAGAKVVLAGRREDRLAEVAAALPGSLTVATDVAVDDDLARLAGRAVEEHGRVDILVNNAGTAFAGRAQEETPEHIDATLRVNLTAALRLAQLVYEPMVGVGGGSIVNVASIAGSVGIGGRLPQASYAASKAGLMGLTRELAVQWARDGIRVNAIVPGFFASEMTDGLLGHEKISDFILGNSPLRRTGVPGDFDGALLLLASDAGSFMTGETLHVDGGWTAR
ncbi:MAG: SDR family oxidoreductase [Solirubrobacterales bacterium]